jgi:glycosyltransferase involved in cell wall biosynthesis
MSAQHQQHLMLSDALERIAANPTANHLWLNLMALLRELTDAALLQQVVQAISTLVPADGLAGFYRAAILDIATGDPVYLPQACACLQTLTPFDLDRCAAFYDSAWQRVLLYANSRPEFIARLKEVGLPQLARAISTQLGRYLAAGAPTPAAAQVRRVALLVPQFGTLAHPPTQMALDQARVLIEQGVEVSLFSCQEAMVPDRLHLLGTGSDTPLQTDLQPWLDSIGANVSVYLADRRFSMLRRWLDMLGRLDAYAPDMVLFVGLHSGLAASVYQRYPVLGMAINSVSPMVPTDVWLTAQAKLAGGIARPWSDAFPASTAYHHPFRVRRKPTAAALPRAELGVEDDALLCITMGSHLEVKIDGDWAQRMCGVMTRHPKLIWLLVGGAGQLPPALEGLPPQRLRLQPYTPKAAQWLAASDIYLHPPIMGGGFSVAEAMSQGIPALAMADADGGDKAGSHALPDHDAYFAQLDALASDPSLRRAHGDAMRRHFDQTLDLAASGPGLLGACALTLQRYRLRIKPTDA